MSQNLPKAKLSDVQERFRILVTSFHDPDEIDDKTMEVYGETFPEIDTPCDKAPAGQCEFSVFDPEVCIWCGRKT